MHCNCFVSLNMACHRSNPSTWNHALSRLIIDFEACIELDTLRLCTPRASSSCRYRGCRPARARRGETHLFCFWSRMLSFRDLELRQMEPKGMRCGASVAMVLCDRTGLLHCHMHSRDESESLYCKLFSVEWLTAPVLKLLWVSDILTKGVADCMKLVHL